MNEMAVDAVGSHLKLNPQSYIRGAQESMKSGAKIDRGCGCRQHIPKNSKLGEIFKVGSFL